MKKRLVANYGLDLTREKAEQDGTEWIFGDASKPCIAQIPVGERGKYLPKGEVQQGKEDTMDCATRAPINKLETKFNFLFAKQLISKENEKWLRDNGYVIDVAGNISVEFSDAFIAILSGTTENGNSLKAPLQAIHTFGLVPKKLLPLESWMTWKDYHNPQRITPELKDLGRQFKERFPIFYEQVKEKDYKKELEKDILDVASYAWPDPKNGIYPRVDATPNHAYIIFDFPKWQAFDNYIDVADRDFIKNLAPDYDFLDYGYRIYIEEVKLNSTINNNSMEEQPSVRYQFNTTEGNKVFKSLLLSLGGFILVKLIELVGQFDFGQFTPLVAALAPFAINAIRLFIQGQGAEVLAKKK